MRMKWAVIIGVWAVLGLIWAGPIYLETHLENMGHSPLRSPFVGHPDMAGVGTADSRMIWLARRFSLIGGAWKSSLLVHFPAFLLMSFVHSAAGTIITLGVKPFDEMGESPIDFWPQFFRACRVLLVLTC